MAERDARKTTADKPGLAARAAAVRILRSVLEDHVPLADLTGADGPLEGLSGPDRARAQRLAATALRHLDRADHLLGLQMERLPPPAALAVLRLAVVELCELGEAAHGVVDSAVSLMRKNRKTGQMSGLANAVLRKIALDGPAKWQNLPPQKLAPWLRRRMVHIYKEDTVQRIEAAHLAGAPLDLTLKPGLCAGDWAERLGAAILPTGSLRLSGSPQVTELDGYGAGAWWVQDAAAALPARLLDAKPGETVLDLCAAPGGKTMQLAACGADVIALDLSETRMARVRENLSRTGLDAQCVVADALRWQPEKKFDAILLDAPCSATGTIRRHPDLPYVKHGRALDDVFALQSQLIDIAAGWLKPGGRLVYATCSLLTEEGERQATQAMARLGLVDATPDPSVLGLDPTWAAASGGIRLRPDYWAETRGMDGFFMIAFRKPD